MFYPALGALTGMWLLGSPLLWTDLPARGVVAGAAGFAGVALSVMGIASQKARTWLWILGLMLGLSNFFIDGPIGSLANFAVAAVALMASGLAPSPRVVPAASALPSEKRPSVPAPETSDRAAA